LPGRRVAERRAAGELDCRGAGLPGCRGAGLRERWVAGAPGCRGAGRLGAGWLAVAGAGSMVV
jgi:hypothetical protein